MARTRRSRQGVSNVSDSEGILAKYGLAAVEITGDGNCLFSALSDQIYGNPTSAAEVRQSCIDYMKRHAEHFKTFIDVYPGGGTRRNPKRKNVACAQVNVEHMPTDEERTRAFDAHIQNMSKSGTWGGHMEITAFMGAYGCRVTIWQSQIVYDVGGIDPQLGSLPAEPRMAHIFYHADYEHYSSVRNSDGPYQGPPNITVVPEPRSQPTEAAKVEDWRKRVVQDSLGFEASESQVSQALLSSSNDIDGAVTKLMESHWPSSPGSTPGSSSVERDQDEDDGIQLPNKRQDRRLSHATRAMMKASHRQRMSSAFSPPDDRDSPIPSDTGSFRPHRLDSDSSSSISDSQLDQVRSDPPEPIADKPIRLTIKNPPKSPDPPEEIASGGKTRQRQSGPSQRGVRGPSARDRKELKKQAQKQARKERARSEAQEKGIPIMTKTEKPSSPGVVNLSTVTTIKL